MLSNPTPNLHQRQRLHRRQNSTPITTYEALKVPTFPAPGLQRPTSHRRGQSLDQRSPIRRSRVQYESVSITNKGSTTNEQQILREAQQQRIARPGQRYQDMQSPQCGIPFNETDFHNMQTIPMNGNMYNTSAMMDAFIQPSVNPQFANGQIPISQGMSGPMAAAFEGIGLGLDENAGHFFQQSQQMMYDMQNNASVDLRRMSQPELQGYGQRPVTPTQQANNVHLPLTPATTPFKRNYHVQYTNTTQSSPTKAYGDETIKASQQVPMQRGRSLQSIFEGQVSQSELPSPPGTAPLTSSSTFDVAMMPTPGLGNFDDLDKDPFDEDFKRKPSPSIAQGSSPSPSSMQSTPDLSHSSRFDDSSRVGRPRAAPLMLPSSSTVPNLSSSTSPTRPALSPRRMSISDLNLEPGISASIRETDITLDDIAQFIEGPDLKDNKWICRYEDCNKRFGRKENIKSHVQTHLGDRQFKCDHCNKCFVRGHDLKRHAKIHSGAKPYPCLCGNAFARHDALTRHRQRGMCIGAFENAVRKVVKRGRPRKHRPDMDERLDKSSKTRQRADQRDRQQYASSISDSSVSSYQSPPPTETFESLSIRGSSPFDDMNLFSQPTADVVGLPPELFTFTPPASPGFSTGNKPSPMHHSMTPTDLASIPEAPSSPLQRQIKVTSHQSPPPSLCHSSSSPIPETQVYDYVDGLMTTTTEPDDMTLKDIERADFDSFFDYGAGMTGQDDFFGQL